MRKLNNLTVLRKSHDVSALRLSPPASFPRAVVSPSLTTSSLKNILASARGRSYRDKLAAGAGLESLKPVRGRLADNEDKEWMCLTGRFACSGQCKKFSRSRNF